MEQYISKSAIVAEIEKNKNEMEPNCGWHFDEYTDGYLDALKETLSFINTLEVKESLTWEDIRELYIIFAEVDAAIEFCKTNIKPETIGYYQEVLKRFKA